MKILRLSKSDDLNEQVAAGDRVPAVAARAVHEATGLDVTTETKFIWPTPDLPERIDRWLTQHEPDTVTLWVSAYWFTYESVPMKVRRHLKWVGEPIADAGIGAAARWAGNPAFKLLQKAAVRTIGGEAQFTTQEVIHQMEESIRRIVAKESVVLVVLGPMHRFALSPSAERSRGLLRCGEVDAALAAFCARLGVRYLSVEELQPLVAKAEDYFPDGVHVRPRLHRLRGEAEGRTIAEAWQMAHAGG